MTIARELVTLLKYQVDKSGLSQYQRQATTAVGGLQKRVKAVGVGARDAFHGFNLGIRDGIREHRALNAVQTKAVANTKAMAAGYNQVGGYLRTMIAALGVMSSASLVDEFAGVRARVSIVVDASELDSSVDDLFAIAQRTGQEYAASGGLFQTIARNQKELELVTQDSLKLTEIVGQAMTIGGGSAAAQQGALIQLSQALGSGVLRGQELNSILEQSPRLAQAIAESFEVPVGKLKELGEQGKLTSKDLAKGILGQGQKIGAEFEKMPKTFGRGMTLMRNAWGRFAYDFDRSIGVSQKFFVVAEAISESMASIAKTLAFAGATWGLMRLSRAAGAFRLASLAALAPWLRMAAVVTSIYLLGDDILTWLRGGESVTGALIGSSSEWKSEIEAVKGFLTDIKALLGGADEETTAWAKKWGTIALLAFGLNSGLKMIGINLRKIGVFIVTRMLWPLAAAVGAIIGVPALMVIAIAAAVAALVIYWDEAKAGAKDLWKSFTDGAEQSWVEIKRGFQGLLNWFDEKGVWLKNLFADMAPDWLKWVAGNASGQGVDVMKGINIPASLMQGGGNSASSTDNRKTEINIHGVPGNPAAVGKAAEQGVNRAYGPAVPVAPNWGSPNVEALP